MLDFATVCETCLAIHCETGLAKGVTRCNVSDTNSQSLRKVETFQLLVKPVSQREATQVHDIERCYTSQYVMKPVSQWRCQTDFTNHCMV